MLQHRGSLRSRILIVVLTVGVIPLGLIGVWLTRSAARSGERILRAGLDDALEETVATLSARWLQWRSSLLEVAEDAAVQRALREGAPAMGIPAGLREGFRELGPRRQKRQYGCDQRVAQPDFQHDRSR